MAAFDDQRPQFKEILRRGGPKAVALFTDVAREFYHKDGAEGLMTWVNEAAPALPEFDRNAVIMALLQAVFLENEMPTDEPGSRYVQ